MVQGHGQRSTDPNEVTGVNSAWSWFQSIRQGFVYDKFGIKTKFNAKVLSRPVFISGDETTTATLNTKFMYKARILGNPSPHDYLPDPCDANLASNEEQATKIINLHTTFISSEETSDAHQAPPKIGDVVIVRLDPGAFSYNLYNGSHMATKEQNHIIVRDPTGGNTAVHSCRNLTELFGTGSMSITVMEHFQPDPWAAVIAGGGVRGLVAEAKRCRGPGPAVVGPDYQEAPITYLASDPRVREAGINVDSGLTYDSLCCGDNDLIQHSAGGLVQSYILLNPNNGVPFRHTIDLQNIADDEYITELGTVALCNPEFLCPAQLRLLAENALLCGIQSIAERELHRRSNAILGRGAIDDAIQALLSTNPTRNPSYIAGHPGEGPRWILATYPSYRGGYAWGYSNDEPAQRAHLLRQGHSDYLWERYRCHPLAARRTADDEEFEASGGWGYGEGGGADTGDLEGTGIPDDATEYDPYEDGGYGHGEGGGGDYDDDDAEYGGGYGGGEGGGEDIYDEY